MAPHKYFQANFLINSLSKLLRSQQSDTGFTLDHHHVTNGHHDHIIKKGTQPA